MLHWLILFLDQISIVEPLTGIIGQPASIYCQLGIGNTSLLLLRLNGEEISDLRFTTGVINTTHREFIMNPVQIGDNGAHFSCAIAGFNSASGIFFSSGKMGIGKTEVSY